MAQVAAQAEAEARRCCCWPPPIRRPHGAWPPSCAPWPRRRAEGAREGRARLAMELLAVEQALDRDRRRGCREPKPGTGPAVRRGARRRSSPRRPPSRSPPPRRPPPEPASREAGARARAIAAAGAWSGDAAARRRGRHPRPLGRGRRACQPGASSRCCSECRPMALDGARLTLAFPEERGFMREKVANRAGSHRAAAGHRAGRHLGGRVRRQQRRARAAHGAAGGRRRIPAIRTARPCWRASCASPAVSWSTRLRSADLVSIHAAPRAGFASQS